jgi:hypothetical protein
VRVELVRRGGLRAWYHKNIGFNSFIQLGEEPEIEIGQPQEPTYFYTRIDRFGLGYLDITGRGIVEDLLLDQFWSAEWQGFFVPDLTGNQTLALSSDGSILLELDGVVVYDGLPKVEFQQVPRPTNVRLPVYLTAEKPVKIRLAYAHGMGRAFIRFALSREEGPDRHLDKVVPDERWFYRRTVLNTNAEGRNPQEDHVVYGKFNFTTAAPTDIMDGLLHYSLVNTTRAARAAVVNTFFIAARDVFGNYQYEETPLGPRINGYLVGPPRVDLNFRYGGFGKYEVTFAPVATGPTLIVITVTASMSSALLSRTTCCQAPRPSLTLCRWACLRKLPQECNLVGP